MKFKTFIIVIIIVIVGFMAYDLFYLKKYEKEIGVLIDEKLDELDVDNISYEDVQIKSYNSSISLSNFQMDEDDYKLSSSKVEWKIPFQDAIKLMKHEDIILKESSIKFIDVKLITDSGRIVLDEAQIEFDGLIDLTISQNQMEKYLFENDQKLAIELINLKYQMKNGIMLNSILGNEFGELTKFDKIKFSSNWNADKSMFKISEFEIKSKKLNSVSKSKIVLSHENDNYEITDFSAQGKASLHDLVFGNESGYGSLKIDKIFSDYDFDYKNIQKDMIGNADYHFEINNLKAEIGEEVQSLMNIQYGNSVNKLVLKNFSFDGSDDKQTKLDCSLDSNLAKVKLKGTMKIDKKNFINSIIENCIISISDLDKRLGFLLDEYPEIQNKKKFKIMIKGSLIDPEIKFESIGAI